MKDLATANLDNMTPAEFEEYLPELFESGGGSISKDPRFANFFTAHPDCAALVSDLEIIAEQAKSLFEPSSDGTGPEPSDAVWSNIASKLKQEPPTRGEDGPPTNKEN
ncbi:MAG: hypothetical protein ABR971_12525 [Acidobacteriaceae bacterium]|jgi:hypothetical protein